MKILVIASWYPSEGSPVAGLFVRDQVDLLSQAHDVRVIAPALVGRKGAQAGRLLTEAPRDLPDRVPTRRPFSFVLHRSQAVTAMVYRTRVMQALGEFAKEGWVPDLVHAHVVAPGGLAAVSVKRRLRIPIVLTEHSSPFSVHLRTAQDRRRVAAALRAFDRVLVVGTSLGRDIEGLSGIRAEVVGNVVSPSFFAKPLAAKWDGGPINLLGIGLLRPQKRFDLLIRAFARVRADLPETHLRIVGDGPDRLDLERLVDELHLRSSVTIAGAASRDEVQQSLANAHALVSSSAHESFGLSVAEALAAGLPVIVTASGGPEEFVGADTGLVVPAGDEEALSAALRRLPALLANHQPAASRARIASKFGPEAYLDCLTEVYRSATRS